MLLDNFEQHIESFIVNTQNACKSAGNHISGFNNSKNELLKLFRGFRVLEYALWQKNKNPEMPEINRKISKSKNHPVLKVQSCKLKKHC